MVMMIITTMNMIQKAILLMLMMGEVKMNLWETHQMLREIDKMIQSTEIMKKAIIMEKAMATKVPIKIKITLITRTMT